MSSTDKGGPAIKTSGTRQLPSPKVPQSEIIQTLNHLYQASILCAIRSTVLKTSPAEAIRKTQQLHSLARKATLRMDTAMKRSICQHCNMPLMPGLTSKTQCRTFASSSRLIETKCQLCSFKRREIAPPRKEVLSNRLARRNRLVQARKTDRLVRAKVLKYQLARNMPNLTSRKASPAKHCKNESKAPKKWSQRARRRAGRIKAQMYLEVVEVADEDPLLKETSNSSNFVNLPRYSSRMKEGSEWDSGWSQETNEPEKQAIKMLRGDHLLTSGIGRGGVVGK